MQQQRAFFFILFCVTQQQVRTDQESCVRCGSEDEEQPRLYDPKSREIHTSTY
jgi:hypothetical protein